VDAEEIRYNEGTALTATQNTITLDEDDPGKNRAYEFKSIEILSGTGAGQRRDVLSYDQETNLLTITPDWDVVPDGSSVYIMIVNCENNAGGWRLLEASHREPDIPADPHGDSNSNGYTNLEEWLHTLNPVAGLDPEMAYSYSLYPNPSSRTVTLEFMNAFPAANAVKISSILGATVAYIPLDHSDPGDSMQLDLSQLQNGIYVVEVDYSDQVVSQKLVVL
jgi:hypothetical protein